jgi:hypothetical protein
MLQVPALIERKEGSPLMAKNPFTGGVVLMDNSQQD